MMAQVRAIEGPLSDGERIERSVRRRKRLTLFAIGLTGGVIGAVIGAQQGSHLLELAYPWPPALALAAAVLLLLAVILGSRVLTGQYDEVETLAKLKAVKAGTSVFLVGYPIWFILWKGGFLPEPQHVLLFAITLMSIVIASLFYRLR